MGYSPSTVEPQTSERTLLNQQRSERIQALKLLGFSVSSDRKEIPAKLHLRERHRSTLPPTDLLRQDMKASTFYRIAAVLLLLFDIGHTLGFRQSDPRWGVDTLLASMRSIHFDVQGFSRTYWDLFVGAGLSVSVFLLFAAILAWQLGGLSAETLALMRRTAWAFALCFVAVTIVSWSYFFILPIVFSMLITVCLIAAAWFSAKQI
jgi:hypothetical protein